MCTGCPQVETQVTLQIYTCLSYNNNKHQYVSKRLAISQNIEAPKRLIIVNCRAVACEGAVATPPPQNFPNFVKFLGKMAAGRKLCIVDENLAPPPLPPDEIPRLRA